MSLPRRSLHFAAPVPVEGAGVVEQAAKAVERLLPGVELLTVQFGPSATRITPSLRADLLASPTAVEMHLWSHDLEADEEEGDEGVCLSTGLVDLRPGYGRHLRVSLDLPERRLALGLEPRLLMAVGDALGAWWGSYSPAAARFALRDQVVVPATAARAPTPFCLPALALPRHLASPDIPPKLEWCNYWSAPVAARLGFPDERRDQPWHLLAERSLTTGAWCVRLTESPLDLSLPAHVEALRAAYDRFDGVGVRYSAVAA